MFIQCFFLLPGTDARYLKMVWNGGNYLVLFYGLGSWSLERLTLWKKAKINQVRTSRDYSELDAAKESATIICFFGRDLKEGRSENAL